MNPSELQPGPGFLGREQALLAQFAAEAGVRNQIMTCSLCETIGRPHWAALGDLGPCTIPPLPRGWSMDDGRPSGKPVCHDCYSAALDNTMTAYRAYLATPEGQAQLAREERKQDDEG